MASKPDRENKNKEDNLQNTTTPKTTGQIYDDVIPAEEKSPDDMEILD